MKTDKKKYLLKKTDVNMKNAVTDSLKLGEILGAHEYE